MSKLGSKLRKAEGNKLMHKCPGCAEVHQIPVGSFGWFFDGDIECPTFSPSIRHHSLRPRNIELGYPAEHQCHYHITKGKIIFCGDCTHDLVNQTVDLPDFE